MIHAVRRAVHSHFIFTQPRRRASHLRFKEREIRQSSQAFPIAKNIFYKAPSFPKKTFHWSLDKNFYLNLVPETQTQPMMIPKLAEDVSKKKTLGLRRRLALNTACRGPNPVHRPHNQLVRTKTRLPTNKARTNCPRRPIASSQVQKSVKKDPKANYNWRAKAGKMNQRSCKGSRFFF